MWSKQLKDKKIRFFLKNKEVKNLTSLFLINNSSIEPVYRFAINRFFLKKNKDSFRSQVKNRCAVTLRSRSPISDFHLSRISFRSQASAGLLLGVKKSSW